MTSPVSRPDFNKIFTSKKKGINTIIKKRLFTFGQKMEIWLDIYKYENYHILVNGKRFLQVKLLAKLTKKSVQKPPINTPHSIPNAK